MSKSKVSHDSLNKSRQLKLTLTWNMNKSSQVCHIDESSDPNVIIRRD